VSRPGIQDWFENADGRNICLNSEVAYQSKTSPMSYTGSVNHENVKLTIRAILSELIQAEISEVLEYMIAWEMTL
jgi:hypothetical protein